MNHCFAREATPPNQIQAASALPLPFSPPINLTACPRFPNYNSQISPLFVCRIYHPIRHAQTIAMTDPSPPRYINLLLPVFAMAPVLWVIFAITAFGSCKCR